MDSELTSKELQQFSNTVLTEFQTTSPPYYLAEGIDLLLSLLSPKQRKQLEKHINALYQARYQKIHNTLLAHAHGLKKYQVKAASAILTSCSYLVSKNVTAIPSAQDVIKTLDAQKITPAQCRASAPWIEKLGVELPATTLQQSGATMSQFQQWLEEVPESPETKELNRILFAKRSLPECKFIDPYATSGTMVTGSLYLSLLALVTCIMYDIPMESLMRNWYTMVDAGKKKYRNMKSFDRLFRSTAVWHTIVQSVDYCYDIQSLNFLYTLYFFGKCQCSCGTVMLRELLMAIDPTLHDYVWFDFPPRHVRLVVEKENGTLGYVESTSVRYDLMDQDVFAEQLRPEHVDMFNFEELLRVLTTRSETKKINGKVVPTSVEMTPYEQMEVLAKVDKQTRDWQTANADKLSPAAAFFFWYARIAHQMYRYVNAKNPTMKEFEAVTENARALHNKLVSLIKEKSTRYEYYYWMKKYLKQLSLIVHPPLLK